MALAFSQNLGAEMTTSLSLIIPTRGHPTKCEPLLKSLGEQNYKEPFEIVFCITQTESQNLLSKAKALCPNAKVKMIDSPSPGIGRARNLGIHSASGEFLLFLDDDCSLPHPDYLSQAAINIHRSPTSAFSGTYLNAQSSSYWSAFYNYLSHLWLMSFADQHQIPMFIGGCFLVSKAQLHQNQAYFNEDLNLAGEELQLAIQLKKGNVRFQFEPTLSVIHNTQCTLRGLLRKSWNHGQVLHQDSSGVPQRRWRALFRQIQLNPFESLSYLPLLLAFIFFGRFSFYTSKSLRFLRSIGTTFQKHNSKVSEKRVQTQ